MNKKYKFKLMLLSLVLIVLVIFIKVNSKEEKVVTLSINSSYVERVELAKKIIYEKREDVYIDKKLKVNPVVYDLRLLSDNYDSEKTNQYFIREELRGEYINLVCEKAGIIIDESELSDYRINYSTDIIECKKDRIALFNGFDSFESYVDSDKFEKESILRAKYDKLQVLGSEELIKYSDIDISLELKEFSEIMDEQVEEMYKKYKNRNRY